MKRYRNIKAKFSPGAPARLPTQHTCAEVSPVLTTLEGAIL